MCLISCHLTCIIRPVGMAALGPQRAPISGNPTLCDHSLHTLNARDGYEASFPLAPTTSRSGVKSPASGPVVRPIFSAAPREVSLGRSLKGPDTVRLLLLEDDADVAEAIAASFLRRGDAIDRVTTVAAAEDVLAVNDYDVAVLDINLPDGRGTEVLRALRRRGRLMPVLMLTARMDIDDRVGALDLGADDYLVKPFDLRELHARIRALGRRQGEDRSGVVQFGRLALDTAGQVARCDGTPLSLTRREFSLLEALMANRTRIMPKERLFDRMFTMDEEEVGLNAIETYVARLRRKLEGSGVGIRTLRGLGYQLVRSE